MTSNGQTAYEAYREYSDGKSLISGMDIPEWEGLDPRIQSAWEAAGDAVFNTAYEDGYADGSDAAIEEAEEDYEVEELEA